MISRAHRSQSVMSTLSLQDSQLQFYDAIEYFTSDTESDDDSDQETSDVETNEAVNSVKSVKQAIVPGKDNINLNIILRLDTCFYII